MKIPFNKKFKNVAPGVDVTRTSSNILQVSKQGAEYSVDVLLSENMDVEKDALKQLASFAFFESPLGSKVKCACATPDFHTGSSSVPVGAVVVTPQDLVIPSAVGTDINCGMRMHATGLRLDTFLAHKKEIIQNLKETLLLGNRDVPVSGRAMTALFQDGILGFLSEIKNISQGLFSKADLNQMEADALRLHNSAYLKESAYFAPESLQNRQILRDPGIGTLGGGNHFCEFQVVTELTDKAKAFELGLKAGDVVFMVHTGSRDVGFYVGAQWADRARQAYPKGIKHPCDKIYALEGEECFKYLSAMTAAAHYAVLNRTVIAEIVSNAIKAVAKTSNTFFIADVPHNIVLTEPVGNVHRKGATPAHASDLLMIPGSMGHNSYLLQGVGSEKWLNSASHGAGRLYSRQETRWIANKDPNFLGLDNIECITLKQERVIEEAPGAYKDISTVIQAQVDEKIVKPIAVLSPLVTFKA